MRQRLEQMWEQATALYNAAASSSDLRAACDALRQLTATFEQLAKLRVQEMGFEGMTTAEQVAYIKADQALYAALFDDIVAQAEIAAEQFKERAQQADSTQ